MLCPLTGLLQPPALRTVAAIERLGRIKIKRTTVSGWQVWCCCLAAIIFADPVAVISQSSAAAIFAVAGLLHSGISAPAPNGNFPRGFTLSCLTVFHLQAIPLLFASSGAFHGISVTAMLANLLPYPGLHL